MLIAIDENHEMGWGPDSGPTVLKGVTVMVILLIQRYEKAKSSFCGRQLKSVEVFGSVLDSFMPLGFPAYFIFCNTRLDFRSAKT